MTKIEELQVRESQATDQLKSVQNELTLEVAEQETLRDQRRDDISKLVHEIAEHESQRDQLQNDLDELIEDVTGRKASRDQLQGELDELNEEVAEQEALREETPTINPEIEMIEIPAGPFLMGSDEGEGDEKPQREVYLDAYEIAKYPLTNDQYKTFLDANLDHPEPQDWENRNFPEGKANHPVVRISRDDATACAQWYDMRLLTEAEWEKAARGTDGRVYPWGNEFDQEKCNTRESGLKGTTPVDKYPEGTSPYEVMDMAGNVWERCADWFDGKFYTTGDDRNPTGPKEGKSRVFRGGSWLNRSLDARCAYRGRDDPGDQGSDIGVRFPRTL